MREFNFHGDVNTELKRALFLELELELPLHDWNRNSNILFVRMIERASYTIECSLWIDKEGVGGIVQR